MSFENPAVENNEKSINEMTFEDLYNHPEYSKVLEEKALETLKSGRDPDRGNFGAEYTGDVDEEGYLIRRDGKKGLLKATGMISTGVIDHVLSTTKEELINRQNK